MSASLNFRAIKFLRPTSSHFLFNPLFSLPDNTFCLANFLNKKSIKSNQRRQKMSEEFEDSEEETKDESEEEDEIE